MISYRPLPTPADLAHAWHGDRTDPRGLADTPQAIYMRAWRRKRKAEGGRA